MGLELREAWSNTHQLVGNALVGIWSLLAREWRTR